MTNVPACLDLLSLLLRYRHSAYIGIKPCSALHRSCSCASSSCALPPTTVRAGPYRTIDGRGYLFHPANLTLDTRRFHLAFQTSSMACRSVQAPSLLLRSAQSTLCAVATPPSQLAVGARRVHRSSQRALGTSSIAAASASSSNGASSCSIGYQKLAAGNSWMKQSHRSWRQDQQHSMLFAGRNPAGQGKSIAGHRAFSSSASTLLTCDQLVWSYR